MFRKGLVCAIVILFVGTSTAVLVEPTNATFTKTKVVIGVHDSSRDETELHYYDPSFLIHFPIWIEWPPCLWKEAIRLTQTELAPFKTWNLTEVVIGFDEQYAGGPMNVRIYVYGNGTATHPGSVMVSDTTATLNGYWLITVPLNTPVSLAGHDEIWVAVEWDHTHWINPWYALIDLGPAVGGKGDWLSLGNTWDEIHDGNWVLGAVVEGENQAPNPPTITGSPKGKIGTAISYHFTAIDPEGSNVRYFIDWGDKTQDYWLGPYPSGETVDVSHTWSERGTYTIRAIARDFLGNESDWGTLEVTMPRTITFNLPFLKFLERFPNAFPVLRHLLKL